MATFARVRFIKAVKIFDGAHYLPLSSVVVLKDGKILEVTNTEAVPSEKIEILDGILTPGFINAHCHLELSHLRGRLHRGTGFCEFASELMTERDAQPLHVRHAAMQTAIEEMSRNGIAAAGDISNTAESFPVKQADKSIYFHTFIELIGLNPDMAARVFSGGKALLDQLFKSGLQGSLTPHAPYSVSDDLLSCVADHNRAALAPISIHCQESLEETRFFKGEACKVHDLYRKLNIDISFYKPPGRSSLFHILAFLRDSNPLLVHNTFATAEDVEYAAGQGASWCFCPKANLFIEGSQPDYSLFRDHARRVCVGTDSLASNDSLDLLSELNIIAEASVFTEEQLLAMICSNGADALSIDDRFGHLSPGTRPGLNLLKRHGTKFELVKVIS